MTVLPVRMMVTAVVVALTVAAVSTEDLRITVDQSRPLTLYHGPSTYRRDARGRPYESLILRAERPSGLQTPSTAVSSPSSDGGGNRDARAQVFKPIVVTSRPFGFGSINNEIQKQPITTTTTTTMRPTTTEAPFVEGNAPPTIPFFSISCTFGSPCSQIIAARPTKTPKPTFKPYTKEEIEKAKFSLSALFPSSFNVSRSTTAAATPSSTSTAKPATTTTTTTTRRPNTAFRIRTTSAPFHRRPAPVYNRSTTKIPTTSTPRPPVRQSTTKYPDLWSQWIWPSVSGSNSIPPTTTTTTTTTSTTAKPTPYKYIDRNQFIYNRRPTIENKSTETTKLTTWTLAPQYNPTTSSPKPVTNKPARSTTTKPISAYQGHWMSLLSATLNGLQKQNQNVKPKTPKPQLQNKHPYPVSSSPLDWSNDDQNSLYRKPVSSDQNTQGVITIKQPAVVNFHEIISTKGNKVALITGSKKQSTTPPPAPTFQLPPEVSISSHVIGLKVKPKSLNYPAHTEQIQGVEVETDGEDVNLSHLIMRQNIPRPARYLTSIMTPYGHGYPTALLNQPIPPASGLHTQPIFGFRHQ